MLGADQRAVMAGAAAKAAGERPSGSRLPGNRLSGSRRADPAGGRRVGLRIGGLALGMLAATASWTIPEATAVEWIVGGSISQRLEAETGDDDGNDGNDGDSGNGGQDDDDGLTFGATTALGLDLTALTPTTQWQAETGASLAVGGSDDEEDQSLFNPNFAAAVSHNGKYIDTGASFSFDMQPSSIAQFEETGVTEGDATQVSVQLAADAAYALDARNQLIIGGSGRIIRFTGGSTELNPNTTYGVTLSWGHSISAVTQASLSLGARRYTAETEENPDSLIFDLSAGASHLVNRRLSLDGSLGVSANRTNRTFDLPPGFPPGLIAEEQSEFSLGATGGLGVVWRVTPETSFDFAFSHGLEPSSLGELQTTTALGAGVQHAINSWASAGVDLLLQRQSAGEGFEEQDESDQRTLASIAPSISFSLTPDWALQAGYALTLERDGADGGDGGDAGSDSELSNRVFLTLSRQFDILP
jgi:hypothetical protein